MVCVGKEQDINSWMELVRTIRWNLPGLETENAMSEHRQTVLRFMKERSALCVKSGNTVTGVILFSKKHNMICCLAVHPDYRSKGIGSALLAAALNNLDPTKDITVTTFRKDDERGTVPRRLYQKFGFAEAEQIEEFGCPSQKFVRRSMQTLSGL